MNNILQIIQEHINNKGKFTATSHEINRNNQNGPKYLQIHEGTNKKHFKISNGAVIVITDDLIKITNNKSSGFKIYEVTLHDPQFLNKTYNNLKRIFTTEPETTKPWPTPARFPHRKPKE